MIKCIIDGHEVVPSLRDNIKLTKENPFVNSGGSYTYDVIFPLSILQNVQVFGVAYRHDVSKIVRKFADCRLYADGRLVIRGEGIVTSINEQELRLQIVFAPAGSMYPEIFGSTYIDRMDYMQVDEKYKGVEGRYAKWSEDRFHKPTVYVTEEIEEKGFIGEKGKYVFMLTHIAGTDPQKWSKQDNTYANHLHMYCDEICMTDMAVQPSLLYIIRTVLQNMGYDPDLSAYDRKPWNDLYIANVTKTIDIAKTLPHWTVQTLLEEFRRLFNAVFVFDEERRTVRLVPNSESGNADVVELRAMDEFESNYDSDGQELLESSNIEFSLSANHPDYTSISREIMKHYPVADFNDPIELEAWRNSVTERELMTTFIRMHGFSVEDLYLYYARILDDDHTVIQPAGIFRPLFRDLESTAAVTLRMVPVATETLGGDVNPYMWYERTSDYLFANDTWLKGGIVVPVVDERPERLSDDGFVSIYEALDEGESPDKEETEEDDIIELMFATDPSTYNAITDLEKVPRLPKTTSDIYLYDGGKVASLSLNSADGIDTVGKFHVNHVNNSLSKAVENNNELCFKFLYDDIPDPTKIYNIRNKLFLCSKIEVSITPDGIDQVKTGYFYEIIS